MKKAIVAAILGIVIVSNSHGAGSIYFDNYTQGTYNQVIWGNYPGKVAGTPVTDPVVLQFYYAEGVYTDLNSFYQVATLSSITATINPAWTYPGMAGNGGWFTASSVLILPTWAPGSTFTFLAAPRDIPFSRRSDLWQESAAIHPTASPQSGFLNFPGLIIDIPEPSTFALAGLGSAGLWIFRRRKA